MKSLNFNTIGKHLLLFFQGFFKHSTDRYIYNTLLFKDLKPWSSQRANLPGFG